MCQRVKEIREASNKAMQTDGLRAAADHQGVRNLNEERHGVVHGVADPNIGGTAVHMDECEATTSC